MRPIYYIYLTFFCFSSFGAFASREFHGLDTFKNVLISYTGNYNETNFERSKIIGKLSEQLCEMYNYSDTVLLDLFSYGDYNVNRDYGDNIYFLGIDDGRYHYTWEIPNSLNNSSSKDTSKFINSIKKKFIHIRLYGNEFDPYETLHILDYAIRNKNQFLQNEYLFNFPMIDNRIYLSLSSSFISNILKLEKSGNLSKVLSMKIFCPEEKWYYGISYYLENNQYIFYGGRPNAVDTIFQSFKTVKRIWRTSSRNFVIFDTDTSFYFISYQDFDRQDCIRKQILGNKFKSNEILNVSLMGNNKVFILYLEKLLSGKFIQKSMIYLTDSNQLIEDLDLLINKCK